jgi:hypothetical protein
MWILVTVLVFGAQVRSLDVTCPDGTVITVHERLAEAPTGWDADGATYESGARPYREVAVATCPDGLSLRASDMVAGLSPKQRDAASSALDRIRAEIGPGTDPRTLPPWERHAHAARIYEALGRWDAASALWLSAAWLVRDQGVTGMTALGGPALAHQVLVAARTDIPQQAEPEVRKRAAFNAALLAHRAGWYTDRDRWLVEVDAVDLADFEAARVRRFRWAIATEPAYLERAAAALHIRWSAASGPVRTEIGATLAEVLRRLGQSERAAAIAADALVTADPEHAAHLLLRYVAAELAGKEPWNDPEFKALAPPRSR